MGHQVHSKEQISAASVAARGVAQRWQRFFIFSMDHLVALGSSTAAVSNPLIGWALIAVSAAQLGRVQPAPGVGFPP